MIRVVDPKKKVLTGPDELVSKYDGHLIGNKLVQILYDPDGKPIMAPEILKDPAYDFTVEITIGKETKQLKDWLYLTSFIYWDIAEIDE